MSRPPNNAPRIAKTRHTASIRLASIPVIVHNPGTCSTTCLRRGSNSNRSRSSSSSATLHGVCRKCAYLFRTLNILALQLLLTFQLRAPRAAPSMRQLFLKRPQYTCHPLSRSPLEQAPGGPRLRSRLQSLTPEERQDHTINQVEQIRTRGRGGFERTDTNQTFADNPASPCLRARPGRAGILPKQPPPCPAYDQGIELHSTSVSH